MHLDFATITSSVLLQGLQTAICLKSQINNEIL